MKTISLSISLALLGGTSAFADSSRSLTPDMLDVIIGDNWTGSLTYLDYQAPFRDVTIPAEINISRTETGIVLAYQYPDEPQANATMQVEIGADGQSFMNEPIVVNQVLETGVRQIKTENACEDMGRPAICEMTYSFSSTAIEIKKMVTYDGETESFRRNAFAFHR